MTEAQALVCFQVVSKGFCPVCQFFQRFQRFLINCGRHNSRSGEAGAGARLGILLAVQFICQQQRSETATSGFLSNPQDPQLLRLFRLPCLASFVR